MCVSTPGYWLKGLIEHVVWTLLGPALDDQLAVAGGQAGLTTVFWALFHAFVTQLAHFWHCCILADRHMPVLVLHHVLAVQAITVSLRIWGSLLTPRLRVDPA
jgi:hypothetical protein